MKDIKLELLKDTFESKFDISKFKGFIGRFFNKLDMPPEVIHKKISGKYDNYINLYYTIAKYRDNQNNELIVMAVELKKDVNMEVTRSIQRDFIVKILDKNNLNGAIVAFYVEGKSDWKFSFIKQNYPFADKDKESNLTSAIGYSYLAGENEPSYIAQIQLLPVFENNTCNPGLDEIENAFNVEKIRKIFFVQYKEKYLDLREYLESNKEFINEAKKLGFEVGRFSEQFASKLMGQLILLYFLQKNALPSAETVLGDCTLADNIFRGNRSEAFVRKTFDFCVNKANKNFFNDYLKIVFCKILNTEQKNYYYKEFNCKTSISDKRLSETLEDYCWKNANFEIPNKLFSNQKEKGENANGILDIFDRFNFTMNEDQSAEKEIAIDPEMLGKTFENLLGVKDRRSKGTFYTPREIVHHMCQESLINYLTDEIDIPYEGAREFILYGVLVKDQNNKYKERYTRAPGDKNAISQSRHYNIKKIDDALKNVKVIDLAVGSGAFLLGMLNEIVKARNNITEYIIKRSEDDVVNYGYKRKFIKKQRSPYKIKLETIKNCIFAIDIEPAAIDIVKLRLWLSVIVDQKTDNKNLEPYTLSDLDMNIYTGNSLIDEWELKFKKIFKEKGGFDIVIGNPPYLGEKGNKEIFRSITQTKFGKKYYRGKMDLFYFFFHKGIDVCRDGGIIGFITTNYYVTANGADVLRRDIKNRTNILKLTNFNELKIFESALGQHSLITLLRKNVSKQKFNFNTEVINIRKSGYITEEKLQDILKRGCEETDYFCQTRDKLFDGEEAYIRITEGMNNKLQSILNRISRGVKIDKICYVNQGIVSGADKLTSRHINRFGVDGQKDNGIFVLTEDEKRDKAFKPQEEKLLKPFFKNSDIWRYKSNIKTNKYIIYIDRNLKEIGDKYPNIEKHFDKYYPILTERREARNGIIEYFHLHWGRREDIFKGKKIIAPQRSKLNTFAYNDIPWYSSADVYYITSKHKNIELKYLLGVLNSRLYYIWFYHRGKRKGEMLELYQTPLKEVPVILSKDKMKTMVELVDAILKETDGDKISMLQSNIDRLVYEIYGLSNQEIKWVETFLLEKGINNF